MASRTVSNSCDLLDVRDVIERFEELEGEHSELVDAVTEARESTDADESETLQDLIGELAEWGEENGEEFESLGKLLDDMKGNGGDHEWRGDWYPVTLIRDSYFVDAMIEQTKDIGDLPKVIPGYLVIDWERTAENLRADYTEVEFDGVTYWYR